MTTTLLLRLAAPRQSWGEVGTERFRPTAKIPTYTGVRGLLAACLGVPRGEDHPALEEIALSVRVDRPGTPESDFHTVSPPPPDLAIARQHSYRVGRYDARSGRADFTVPLGNGRPWEAGKNARQPSTHRSDRQYLAGAEFIAAVTGDVGTIDQVASAAHRPVFTPYLGRQAFAPTFPFHLGVRDGDGLSVLSTLPTTSTRAALAVYELTPGRPRQVARIAPPHTSTPLTDWKP